MIRYLIFGSAFAALLPATVVAGQPSYPATTDLVAGAQACAVRAMKEPKMVGHLVSLGWEKRAFQAVRGVGNLYMFGRNGVELTYFHAKEMKQCIVKAPTDPAVPIDSLVDGLTTLIGKSPKVEVAGQRYLYFLPRLDILTLQVKPAPTGPYIELSVVH